MDPRSPTPTPSHLPLAPGPPTQTSGLLQSLQPQGWSAGFSAGQPTPCRLKSQRPRGASGCTLPWAGSMACAQKLGCSDLWVRQATGKACALGLQLGPLLCSRVLCQGAAPPRVVLARGSGGTGHRGEGRRGHRSCARLRGHGHQALLQGAAAARGPRQRHGQLPLLLQVHPSPHRGHYSRQHLRVRER